MNKNISYLLIILTLVTGLNLSYASDDTSTVLDQPTLLKPEEIVDVSMPTTSNPVSDDKSFSPYETDIVDFSTTKASQSVVQISVNNSFNTTSVANGVAISEHHVLTTESAVKWAGTKLSVDGMPGEVIQKDSNLNWALIRVPSANFIPALVSKVQSLEGRVVFSITAENGGFAQTQGVIAKSISVQTQDPGYIDLSIAPDILAVNGSVVFNNCGELLAIVDSKKSQNVSTAIGLDTIKSALTGKASISATKCLSEAEKTRIRAERLEEERKQIEIERTQAEAEAEELRLELQIKLDEQTGDTEEAKDALEQAENRIKDIETRSGELNAKIDKAEKALGEKDKIIKEKEDALEKQKESSKKEIENLEEESEKALKQKTRVVYLLIALLVLGFIVFLVLQSKKKTVQDSSSREDDDLVNFQYDLILRGNNIAIKVPAELLARPKGVIIGRSAIDCDFVIDLPSVSRSHAKFSLIDNRLVIEDLGSANGTVLNNLSLRPGNVVAIRDKDSLQVADALLNVSLTDKY